MKPDTIVFSGVCGIQITWDAGRTVLFALDARYAYQDMPLLLWGDGYTERVIRLDEEPSIAESGRLHGVTHETRAEVIVREIEPSDAMMSPFNRGCSMPVDVIKNLIIFYPEVPMPQLQAVEDDDGLTVTLLLIADTGMYARFSGAWQRIMNPADFLDGYTVEDVLDGAVDQWDRVDQVGKTLPVADLTSIQLPLETQTVASPAEVTLPRVVPAAGELLEEELLLLEPDVTPGGAVPQIRVPEDIPAAIAMAEEDPEARWYVERRIRAFGLEADYPLPWSNDA